MADVSVIYSLKENSMGCALCKETAIKFCNKLDPNDTYCRVLAFQMLDKKLSAEEFIRKLEGKYSRAEIERALNSI